MKIRISLLVVLLSFLQTLSSQSKPENYYNSSFDKIDKSEFDETLKKEGYRYNKYDLENEIANILYQRKTRGQLSHNDFNDLKNQLNKIAPISDGIIVIIYYPGKDWCNQKESNSTWNIFDNDYKKNLKKLNITNQFWIYKNDENLKYYYPKKINWQKDEDQLIENLFFKMHYPCSSSTVIDENGDFISILGEFGKQEIIENIKELKSKK